MNFIAGLILMLSGSREKESFWVLAALMTESTAESANDLNSSAQNGQMDPGLGLPGICHSTVPVMAGLDGFFS